MPSLSASGNESTFVAVIAGTRGAATGAGPAGAGAGAAFVLAVLGRADELEEARDNGASGPSIIIEMMRHTIKVFEV